MAGVHKNRISKRVIFTIYSVKLVFTSEKNRTRSKEKKKNKNKESPSQLTVYSKQEYKDKGEKNDDIIFFTALIACCRREFISS